MAKLGKPSLGPDTVSPTEYRIILSYPMIIDVWDNKNYRVESGSLCEDLLYHIMIFYSP